MNFNVWGELAMGVVLATSLLQFMNYQKFKRDGSNGTRLTLMVKEIFFLGHAAMLIRVSDVIVREFPNWFGQIFGLFFLVGVCCLFAVYVKGFSKNPE